MRASRVVRDAFALTFVLLWAADAFAQASVRVESFSPQGEVRQVRQVHARFSAPMVALGDPRLEDPFEVHCAAPGKGRWADARNWVYDFDEDLPAGLRCRFVSRRGLTAADGSAVQPAEFVFDTGGPAIVRSFPWDGSNIDEEQVFLLRLDAPAMRESVLAHAFCAVEGMAERVPVVVLEGEDREAVLSQREKLGYAYYQLLWPSGPASQVRTQVRSLEQAEKKIVVVRCQRRLPPGSQVQLVWGPGIAAESGIATRQAQRLAFRVRPAFTVHVECSRTEPRAGCIPIRPIELKFSAPVPRELALAARLRVRDERGGEETRKPVLPRELSGVGEQGGDGQPAVAVERVLFEAPFPENSVALIELPESLKDDAGRAPENAARFPLEVRIDEFPPLVKFAADFGILEAKEGGVLPVTLRNVDLPEGGARTALPGKKLLVRDDLAEVASWLRKVQTAVARRGEYVFDEETKSQVWREKTGSQSVFGEEDAPEEFRVEKPEGARPAEVIGIGLGKPGLYVVEIASEKLGAALLSRATTRYVATAALVTNMAVHFKWGRESSQVWVTRLDNGEPVPDAQVELTNYCTGASLWRGRTDRNGIARIGESFGEPHGSMGCGWGRPPMMVSARTAEDFSFTLSTWSEGIAPHDFALPTGGAWNEGLFHTVLDRPLFRAGETVSMKHFLRRHAATGVALPDRVAGEYKITIAHEGSDQRYEFRVNIGADGVGEQQWRIPAEAKLGNYSIYLEDRAKQTHRTGGFKVEEFRLPTMQALLQGPAQPLVRPREVQLDLHVSYLSGGGASGLPVRLRTMVETAGVHHEGYEDYVFGGEPVVEGIRTISGSQWNFDPEQAAAEGAGKARVMPLTLDAQGAARVTVSNLPVIDKPSRLIAELEYADANGELLTSTTRVRLMPSGLTLGIRTEGWLASQDNLRFRVVALDLQGRPRARQKISVSLYRSSAYSYRKRLLGGFYAYETVREISRIEPRCEGETNEQGLLLCELAPGVSGELLIRAETRDANGNVAGATRSVWLAGEEDWWFGGTEGDRMDVLPEQNEYQAGDKARLQVRMPFREATALVTVEREGVLESFVTRLNGREPVVEVPVADNFAPNVFVSVLAVRGRVGRKWWQFFGGGEEREVTALVDLNKPAYRLGTAQIRVGWEPHRLDVRLKPDRTIYRVREQAQVDIEVKRANGKPLPAGGEVAVAAVDEALLELAPNRSWELLEAMMDQRGLEVWTSTAQMQVVGKRHYGRKAVPHGGGGGRERARESFDTLLFWQARVKLDENGRARVAVPLNDSLSSFRVVAVAHAGADLFGTGDARLVTSQELQLLAGLPPLVREGDRFAAKFTVRNAGEHPLTAEVTAQVRPALPRPPAPQVVTIPPGEAREVQWEVSVPDGVQALNWEVTARQKDGEARDILRVEQKAIAAYPVRTYQATIAQLAEPLRMPVERPAGSIPGRGGIQLALQARLGDSLSGVREYMSNYPYMCLEQNLSRAVALRDVAMWNAWMERLPAYMDGDGLLRYFPSGTLPGEDVLTAYVLAIAHEAGWDIPETQKQRLIQGLTSFVEGRIVRGSALPTADLTVRKLAAIEALSRYGAAQPGMLESITIEPNLWPTSAVLDWLGILRRVPGIRGAADKRNAAEGVLRNRLNFQGTTMGFSTERSDALWWLMVSTDSNAVRTLLEVLDRPAWREDIPRLVRGALGRQQRGHWSTTVANAWGVLAMEKFSAAFESTPVGGTTEARYGAAAQSLNWAQSSAGGQLHWSWQDGRQSLEVNHSGGGRPWVTVQASAAMPLKEALSSGFRIKRTVMPVEQQRPGIWSRGDVMRVRLELEAQADMTWVVVEDPVPAGASLLGAGLGTQSQLLTQGEQREGGVWSAYEERRFEAFRAYYRFVPKGKWIVEYTLRLNNPGRFLLPATRVEALYAPEMFGELPNQPVEVQ